MTGSGVKGVPADPAVRRILPDEWQVYRQVRLTALAEAPDAFMSTLGREQGFGEEIRRQRVGYPEAPGVPRLRERETAAEGTGEEGDTEGEETRPGRRRG